MDTTASSFTLHKNAKRAAEAMIRKGTAPAVDYGIKPSGDGRFEIVWKSAKTGKAAIDRFGCVGMTNGTSPAPQHLVIRAKKCDVRLAIRGVAEPPRCMQPIP